MRRETVHGALAVLWERQQASQHGWVLEGPEHLSQRKGVAVLERLGLAELPGGKFGRSARPGKAGQSGGRRD